MTERPIRRRALSKEDRCKITIWTTPSQKQLLEAYADERGVSVAEAGRQILGTALTPSRALATA